MTTALPSALLGLGSNRTESRNAFADWVDTLSPTEAPTTVLAYGAKYGYTPGQLANFYNSVRGTAYTPEESFGTNYNGMLGLHNDSADRTPMTDADAYAYANNLLNPSPGTDTTTDTGTTTDGSSGINFFQPNTYSTSGSVGGSTSGSTSGINWDSPFLQALMPQLYGSVNALPGLLSNYARTLQDQQTNLGRQLLGPQAFQGTLNDLAARGMINSSVASDALSNTAQPIMQSILDSGYNSNAQALNNQLNLPTVLGQLAQLGQEGNSFSNSFNLSQSANPLEPYQLAAQIYQSMMQG